MADSKKIVALFAVHIVCGIFFSTLSAIFGRIPFVLEFILVVPSLAIVCCESCLLALWTIFSAQAWWTRLAGFTVGCGYLEILVYFASRDDNFTFLSLIAAVSVALVLLAMRVWKIELQHRAEGARHTGRDTLRFSVKDLLLVMLFVAAAITATKIARDDFREGPAFEIVVFWALCFVQVNLAAIWATLGLARTHWRCALVLAMSLALASAFSYILRGGPDTWFYVTAIMLLESFCLILSLLVARSCGYRVAIRTRDTKQASIARS